MGKLLLRLRGGLGLRGYPYLRRRLVRVEVSTRWRYAAWVLLLGSVASASGAELPRVDRVEYGRQVSQMDAATEACLRDAGRCAGKSVPADEDVGDPETGGFRVRWEWLRSALDGAKNGKEEGRAELLGRVQARLKEEAGELAGTGAYAGSAAAGGMGEKAEEILGRPEFSRVHRSSYMERKIAALKLAIAAILDGLGSAIPHSAWVMTLVEWAAMGGAVAALLVWAVRLSRRQRLAIAGDGPALTLLQAESDDWAAKAKAEAAKGEWREAVHCLYWSAIVILEGQRFWRQNGARTPREHVALLEPGSTRQTALRGLTGVFEQIWYGLRPASAGDYERAAALLDELRVG